MSVDEVVSDVTKGVIMYNSNNVPLENLGAGNLTTLETVCSYIYIPEFMT